MDDLTFIDNVSFFNVKTPRSRALISFQKQIGKDQMAGRTPDINADRQYFDFVYFHIPGFSVQGSEVQGLSISDFGPPWRDCMSTMHTSARTRWIKALEHDPCKSVLGRALRIWD